MSLLILRLAVIAGALVVWFWTQKLIARNTLVTSGLGDGVHRLTAGWHRHFLANRKSADRALVISSFFIDVLGLSLIGMSLFGETFAPFLGMLIVFSLRQVGNDFFFSGHTALAVLAAIEICRVGPWRLGLAAVIIALGEALIVLVLRAHYTLDVITGALAAWLAADLAHHFCPLLDVWLGR